MQFKPPEMFGIFGNQKEQNYESMSQPQQEYMPNTPGQDISVPQQDYFNYSPPMMQQGNNDTLINQSFETIAKTLEDLECALKGLYWNPIMKKYERKHKPMMADEGINNLMFYVRSQFNVNTVVTNLTDVEINQIMLDFSLTLASTLSYNYKIFRIDNPSTLDIIQTMFVNVMFMALKRSSNFGTFKLLSGATKRMEHAQSFSQENPKKKWFGNV